MSEPAISIRNLSKCYQLGAIGRHTLVDEAQYWWHRLRGQNPREHMGKLPIRDKGYHPHGKEDPSQDERGMFQALNAVSFNVQPGEVIGIIGGNGAGKSTLLKILSRITEPTSGEVFIEGRIGSLLEIGTGFHPELTGRENIYMNGTILGMKKAEIDCKFDEIVAFSELEQFLDTPVKRYSSGMYVRLAFAVASHLEPEILIVDEVLAVGDATFQKKCLGKMNDVAKAGRTILFVSHNMAAVQNLCSRAIWLNKGSLVEDGPTEDVVSRYQRTSFSALTQQQWTDQATAPGNDKVRLKSAQVCPECGSPQDPITVRTPFVLEFELFNFKPDLALSVIAKVYNEQGILVFTAHSLTQSTGQSRYFAAGLFSFSCRIPGDLLNDGMHRVAIVVMQDESKILFFCKDLLAFDVRDSFELRGGWHGKWAGTTRPNLEWSIREKTIMKNGDSHES